MGKIVVTHFADDARILDTRVYEFKYCRICLDPYDVRPLKVAEKYI